jgi:phage terminase small subunit
MTAKAPPAHLRKPTARWWGSVMRDYELEGHHVHLLTLAAEALDRTEQAREALKRQGTVYEDRFGQPRARPEVAIERDSRMAFARIVRELDLDGEPLSDPRPPRGRS